tara:strand:+ start:270 stop:470 length:201 start_codon:yes stop_codon:yes gene_type:complete
MKREVWCHANAAPATVIGFGFEGSIGPATALAWEGLESWMHPHPAVSPETGLPPAINVAAVGRDVG